jgi:hypothetical protein
MRLYSYKYLGRVPIFYEIEFCKFMKDIYFLILLIMYEQTFNIHIMLRYN